MAGAPKMTGPGVRGQQQQQQGRGTHGDPGRGGQRVEEEDDAEEDQEAEVQGDAGAELAAHLA